MTAEVWRILNLGAGVQSTAMELGESQLTLFDLECEGGCGL